MGEASANSQRDEADGGLGDGPGRNKGDEVRNTPHEGATQRPDEAAREAHARHGGDRAATRQHSDARRLHAEAAARGHPGQAAARHCRGPEEDTRNQPSRLALAKSAAFALLDISFCVCVPLYRK